VSVVPVQTAPSLRALGLVFAGGVLGTAAREAIVLLTVTDGVPWAVFGVNVLGAFLLGMLVRGLHAQRETPRRRDARVFVGTGMLGGFTTYSALAADTVLLLTTAPAVGIAYATCSVIAGLAAAVAGWALASRLWPRHLRTEEGEA